MAPKPFVPPTDFAAGLTPYRRLLGILLRESCISISVSNQYFSLAEPAGAVLLRQNNVTGSQLPHTAFKRLVSVHRGEMTGCVLGHEFAIKHPYPLDQHVEDPQARLQPASSSLRSGDVKTPQNHSYHTMSHLVAANGRHQAPPSGVHLPRHVSPNALAAAARKRASFSSAAERSGNLFLTASQYSLMQEVKSIVAEAHPDIDIDFTWWDGWSPESPLSSRLPAPAPPGSPGCSMAQLFLQNYLDTLGSDNTFG